MQPVDRYTLLQPRFEGRRAVLGRDGRTTSVEVDGSLLEAQFELEDGRGLIWLTDDSPYDEGLHVYLLGRDDSVEDALQAGADFTAGILKFRGFGPRWVEFEFFLNSTVYRLEVGETAGFRLRLPAGWRYKSPLRLHRLVLREAGEGGV